MNNNKQLNKGDKMRKIVMIASILTVLSTSAHAVYRDNSYLGGMSNSYYNPPRIILVW